MNTIKDQWEDFARKVIPADAPLEQIQGMRYAFYGGAATMLHMQTMAAENHSEDAAIAMLDGWIDECQVFAKDPLG